MYIHGMICTAFKMMLSLALPFALTGAARPQAGPSPMPAVPTTRVLAIGHIVAGTDRGKVMPVMQQEVRDTVKLYLAGKIDQWYARRDTNGVVLILNVTTVEEAHTMLEKLPLGEGKMMEFELIPLGPLSPLGLLVQGGGTPAK